MNALSIVMQRRLLEIACALRSDSTVHAVVLHGENGCFSAGADIKDPERWEIPENDIHRQRIMAQLGPRMCREWEAIPQPVIVAIEGFAIGGGAGLALCADFRICASNAYLHFPEVSLGMPMGWQSVPRLVALVGAAQSKQLLMLGERISALYAKEIGLITEVAEPGASLDRACALANRLAHMPTHGVAMIKESINVASGALSHSVSYMDIDQISLSTQRKRTYTED
jgi:enoyl-CoA hydratase/carnithine racemase